MSFTAKANASNLSENFRFNSLASKIFFTLFILFICRVGTFIPLPGVNLSAFLSFFNSNTRSFLDIFNLFSGGAVGRMAIFSLSIMPYISASIIIQLLSSSVKKLKELKQEGDQGKRIINQYTKYLTLLLAVFQAYAVSRGLEQLDNVVSSPGLFFQFSTIITLVGGTFFLIWLGEQITARGIGNGISLIIFSGIVAELPSVILSLFELASQQAISSFLMFFLTFIVALFLVMIVFFELSNRKILIEYPKRQMATGYYSQVKTSHLPLKLNTAGVIPPIFASSILLLPLSILSGYSSQNDILGNISTYFGHGTILYILLYAFLIVFFCFFYASLVFDSNETASNLKKYGGFVPGIRPGLNTANYIDYILIRVTAIGAFYLLLVCLLPEILIYYTSVPFYLGGTSLLIVVTVSIDTITNAQSYLYSAKYESLINKAKLKGKRR
jgi:preprotein translocase subunit SecY